MLKSFSVVLFIATFFLAEAQKVNGRVVMPLNRSWQFTKDNIHTAKSIKWKSVNIPHTWNIDDVMDDEPGYHRAVCWYKKTITVPASFKNKNVFLHFEAANQEAEVYVNGCLAGKHVGGYTAFNIPVQHLLKYDGKNNANEILVKVDNSFNESIPPLTADFTFYGGIYRNVSLVRTSKVHFSNSDFASNGVYVSTPNVSAAKAAINIKAIINNDETVYRKVNLVSSLINQQGKKVATQTAVFAISPNTSLEAKQLLDNITNPVLWSPENPYLYKLSTQIVDAATNQVLDETISNIGFRWFRFDADKGFFLNDKHYKLVGTSRHQDYQGLGNAVPSSLAVKDVELIKQMGGNFLRVAHYPQDQAVLDACDRLGIITSVEIPVVNEITETEAFTDNCKNMLVEMVRQNYNHPSVIIWCYMNEVLLKPHFNDSKERQQVYFNSITKLATTLDSLTKKEDATRYTMIANHGDFKKYKDAGLIQLPMLAGWNLYSGWYGNKIEEFPAALDRHHTEFPDKPLLVTEYGADADPRIRSFNPQRFDKSVEYTTKFHQYYMKEMMQRDFVAAAMVWNLADFNSETRVESMPHINNKGLLTWDRKPKDPFYLYKALLSTKPFVKILSTDWQNRNVQQDSLVSTSSQPLQVAANIDTLLVYLNGKQLTTCTVSNGLGECMVPFVQGNNRIKVIGRKGGKQYVDTANLFINIEPNETIASFKPIHAMLGSDRFFIEHNNTTWFPSKEYEKGSWGHVGGKPYKMTNNNRLPYGSDKNIVGTDDDPIYQTQQTGIEQYRFDVPKGEYELQLHFAELLGPTAWPIPYNLSSGPSPNEKLTKRVFNILVNGKMFVENFNIAEQYGISTAINRKLVVKVQSYEGIIVSFQPKEGEAVLNAIELNKIN